MPTNSEGKEKGQQHIRGALKTCAYPNWTYLKTSKRSRADREEETTMSFHMSQEHLKLKRMFNQQYFPIDFKPTNTLREKCVHPEDKTSRHLQNNVVYDSMQPGLHRFVQWGDKNLSINK